MLPVFPHWAVYAETAYADRQSTGFSQAVFHILSPHCFYCTKVCVGAQPSPTTDVPPSFFPALPS